MAQLPESEEEFHLGKLFRASDEDPVVFYKSKMNGSVQEIKAAHAIKEETVILFVFAGSWCHVCALFWCSSCADCIVSNRPH